MGERLRRFAPTLVFSAILLGPCALHHLLPNLMAWTLCLSQRLLGVDCPACGLTRATHHALHLRLGESLESHPFGVVAVLWASLSLLSSGWLAWRQMEESALGQRVLRFRSLVHVGFCVPLLLWWFVSVTTSRL